MLTNDYRIVGDMFKVGYRSQRTWSWSMATSFFFGEIGAGLFFVATFLNFLPGMLVGLAMAAIGKPLGHFLHLGQPTRAWRAITRVRSSWVSRGLVAICLFTGFGSLHIANVAYGLLPPLAGTAVAAVAVLSALVIMVYQGFAMSHSASITLWSNGLMPVTSLTYALLGGVALTMVLGHGNLLAERPDLLAMLKVCALGLLLFGLTVVLSLVHTARYGSAGGHESVELLLRGDYAKWFIPVVVVLGFVVSAVLFAYGGSIFSLLLIASAAALAGYYAFRILMFKAATYDPVMSFATPARR